MDLFAHLSGDDDQILCVYIILCNYLILGLKYEGENEKDLKDQQDFARPDLEHYPKDGKGYSQRFFPCQNSILSQENTSAVSKIIDVLILI